MWLELAPARQVNAETKRESKEDYRPTWLDQTFIHNMSMGKWRHYRDLESSQHNRAVSEII